ncbi:MAG: S41 family peptidase [Phycisphaerae bacterium]|nr:S41 family peptidase [Phycisphaerae bacterium]
MSSRVWESTREGKTESALAPFGLLPENPAALALNQLRERIGTHVSMRESVRAESLAKVNTELEAVLAKEATASNLSKALRHAVELLVLSADRAEVLTQPRIVDLIAKSDAAAREAERTGDWLTANEIFYRLNALTEEQGSHRKDLRRIGDRLAMIRLYVPGRFWELRNNRRLADGDSALPPYNGLGDDYHDKVKAISARDVEKAIGYAASQHVDGVGLRKMLLAGLDAVRTMATTGDLRAAFPGLGDDNAVSRFVSYLTTTRDALAQAPTEPGARVLMELIGSLAEANRTTVGISDQALLHEFGNGAMGALDDFTQIVWPDELARFKRLTEGSFIGVGIQIQMDDEKQLIRVVTPLEGTPAQRAGVKAGDLIKKINDVTAVGISLDQAVELITGRANTRVKLTMEREGQDVDFDLVRKQIPIITVKGWKRNGAHEDDWNWFVDPENRIGYVRLTQFTDSTTRELERAVAQMRQSGAVNGLIMDLRFNPGGLLTQAVSVANKFIDDGTIVYTEGPDGQRVQEENARANAADLRNIPLAVLINEGSASASEIVSGAIRHYADAGRLNAVLIGQRSFGKGSVQNVFALSTAAQMKLTTQYYYLPGGRIIHRRPGAKEWGVEPHLRVEMLPKQITDALTLRQEADIADLNPTPGDTVSAPAAGSKPRPDPAMLLSDGIDLQLEQALYALLGNTLERRASQRADATR